MSGGGGSGGGGQNTVTQTQQIPEWQKDFILENEKIAGGLAQRPYQNYEGQLIAGFTPTQEQGITSTGQAANAYKPNLGQAENLAYGATQSYLPALGYAMNNTQGAKTWGQASPEEQGAYMNPYVMQSLAPQMQQLDLQQAKNRMAINREATQSGAFGDARNAVNSRLNDYFNDIERQSVVGQGYNRAYDTGVSAFQQGQQQQLAQGAQMANLGGLSQQLLLAPSQQYASLADMQQQMGLRGGQAQFNMGTQQQQLQQQQLAAAYQNFMNQVNWPSEQLNLRIAAAANSPYSTINQTTLAPSNATAMNVGAFGALAGGLGSLLNSGGGGGVYGGT